MAPSRADARHEAAHALVAVRLGLPLLFTDVTPRPVNATLVSRGFTGLDDRVLSEMIAAKGAPVLRSRAVFAAAGIVPEYQRGAPADDSSHVDDLRGVREYADRLGIADLPAFLADCINEAAALLLVDEGVTWDRLTTVLLRKRMLRGDDVRAIVAQADTA